VMWHKRKSCVASLSRGQLQVTSRDDSVTRRRSTWWRRDAVSYRVRDVRSVTTNSSRVASCICYGCV